MLHIIHAKINGGNLSEPYKPALTGKYAQRLVLLRRNQCNQSPNDAKTSRVPLYAYLGRLSKRRQYALTNSFFLFSSPGDKQVAGSSITAPINMAPIKHLCKKIFMKNMQRKMKQLQIC